MLGLRSLSSVSCRMEGENEVDDVGCVAVDWAENRFMSNQPITRILIAYYRRKVNTRMFSVGKGNATIETLICKQKILDKLLSCRLGS